MEEGKVGQVAEPDASGFLSNCFTLASHSKNLNNSQSNVVSFPLSVEAQAQVSLNGSVPRQNGAFRGKGAGLPGMDR